MGRIHPYGEPRVEDSPVAEFFCWLFVIGLGVPMSFGWVFVSLGWMSNTLLFELSGALGIVIGFKMAVDTAQHKENKKQDAATTPPLPSEAEKVILLDFPRRHDHHREKSSNVDDRERKGYESR